jgi:hypothetical protein
LNQFQISGKLLILLGLFIMLIGIIILFGGKIPFLGKLPGDINISRENFHFYFPLTTSIILSLLISLVIYIINRFK